MSRKRNRDDEEGDDCLPISKRIHSLRIEGQIGNIVAQNSDDSQRMADVCDYSAGCSSLNNLITSPVMSHSPHRTVNPHFNLSNEQSSYTDPLSSNNEDTISTLNQFGERQSSSTAPSQLIRSFSEPYSSHLNSVSLGQSLIPFQNIEQQNNNTFVQDHQALNHRSYSHHLSNGLSQNDFAHYQIHSQPTQDRLSSSSFQPQMQDSLSDSVTGFQSHLSGEHLLQDQNSVDQFHFQQIPSGPYQPELDMSGNPHYFSVNQMLYEAHRSRERRNDNS